MPHAMAKGDNPATRGKKTTDGNHTSNCNLLRGSGVVNQQTNPPQEEGPLHFARENDFSPRSMKIELGPETGCQGKWARDRSGGPYQDMGMAVAPPPTYQPPGTIPDTLASTEGSTRQQLPIVTDWAAPETASQARP